MDFGIFMEFEIRQGGDQASAFREGFELVDAAEAWGLDGVWLGEMHFTPTRSVLAAPIVVASSIATRTKRLRIGMAGPGPRPQQPPGTAPAGPPHRRNHAGHVR